MIVWNGAYLTVSRLATDKLHFDSAVSFKIRLMGADDTLEQTFSLIDCSNSCDIKIPNVFTPNDDWINDRFLYQTKCVLEHPELLIFNRWGEQLFESHVQGEYWDARGKRILLNGLVHLIR